MVNLPIALYGRFLSLFGLELATRLQTPSPVLFATKLLHLMSNFVPLKKQLELWDINITVIARKKAAIHVARVITMNIIMKRVQRRRL